VAARGGGSGRGGFVAGGGRQPELVRVSSCVEEVTASVEAVIAYVKEVAAGDGAETAGCGARAYGGGAGAERKGVGAAGDRAGALGDGAGASGDGAGASGDRVGASGDGAGASGDGAGASGDGSGASGDGTGASGGGTGASGGGTGPEGGGVGAAAAELQKVRKVAFKREDVESRKFSAAAIGAPSQTRTPSTAVASVRVPCRPSAAAAAAAQPSLWPPVSLLSRTFRRRARRRPEEEECAILTFSGRGRKVRASRPGLTGEGSVWGSVRGSQRLLEAPFSRRGPPRKGIKVKLTRKLLQLCSCDQVAQEHAGPAGTRSMMARCPQEARGLAFTNAFLLSF